MNKHRRPLSLLAASAVAFSLMGAYAAGPLLVPQLPLPASAAMIYNGGNGDYAGYRIVVDPHGRATAVDGAGRIASELEPDIVQKFFTDLAAAGPLGKLPAGDCSTKTTAAATTVEVNAAIVITWHGQRTPALTCVSDASAVRVLLDATTIQHALYVQAYRTRTVVTYGGGYTYKGEGYSSARTEYSGGSGFYIDNFQNQAFSYDQFSSGQFSFDNMHNEYPRSNGPWSSLPAASQVFTNLPYATPVAGSAPSSSLPTVYPWQGFPGTAVSPANPWSNPPSGTSPFVNGPSGVSH